MLTLLEPHHVIGNTGELAARATATAVVILSGHDVVHCLQAKRLIQEAWPQIIMQLATLRQMMIFNLSGKSKKRKFYEVRLARFGCFAAIDRGSEHCAPCAVQPFG